MNTSSKTLLRVCRSLGRYLPLLLLVSLFTGALSGSVTALLLRAMAHTPYGREN